ncbi:MAG TPA: T9SS type A sorting domain-containing protein [Candidatus Kryptonia bacterium]
MKRIVLPVLFAVVAWSTAVYAQEAMIDSLSGIASDPNFVWVANVEGGASTFVWAQDAADKPAGFISSLDIKTKIDSLHAWGSFAQLIYRLPSGQYMDLSSSDTLRLWVKVVKAPLHPEYMSFRIQIVDQDQASDPSETYIYQNDLLLDNTGSWVQLKVPLHEINSQGGTVVPADSGFVEAPYGWGGFTWNNHKLDLANIIGWNIVMVTTTTVLNPNPPAGYSNVPLDSLEVKFAGFDRTGNKPVPFVVFNGIATPANLSIFTWGNASVATETKNGPFPNTNSLHWVMGDQWSNGWNGWGYNVAPAFNLSGGWPVDSLKFYMKADTGVDSMSVQFEDGSAKVRADFNVIQDGNWHQYVIALRDITWRQDTNPGDFNPANVAVWQIMSAQDGKAGKNVWMSDIWTGNPPHPVPPVAVTGLAVVTNSNYTNIISWNDVPNQTNETYNVYYSTTPITTVDTSIVDVAATGIAHGTDSYTHLLMSPKTNQTVQYYYAVVCKSSDGLLGNVAASSTSYSNTAKGVPTIAPLWKLSSPFNFVADGNLAEWKSAGITPFRLYVSDGSGTPVSNSKISGDDVSSGDIYVAMDKTYLYVAGHINTNNIVFTASQSSWFNTSTDLFLGLYDYHGAPHSGLQGGPQPDYHFRFAEDRVIVDNNGTDSLVLPGTNYYWAQRLVPDPLDGYNFEVKVSWADIAHKRHGGYTGTDSVFLPLVGQRIPFDIELSSVSSGATQRDGQLDYSPIAQGNSYANVSLWSFTWVGDQMVVGVKPNATPNTYELSQNYPNPFNPTTTIKYSLMRSGQVTLTVFNVLGEKVTTLVDRFQTAGSYTVTFDASKYASGIYFYEVKAGSFRSVKKMMMIK